MLTTDDTDNFSPMADGTRPTGRDAAQATAADTAQALRTGADEAGTAGRQALNTAKDLAGTARAKASDAWQKARVYAKEAGGVAGEKLGDFKVKASGFQDTAARRIADEPIKAVAIGAAAGALLAALVLRRGRNTRNY
jgi:ElaB/YqjD/DUF883 family membrane-anchored ribosome-binding protein